MFSTHPAVGRVRLAGRTSLSTRHVVFAAFALILVSCTQANVQTDRRETVRDRLWIWGHPAGVYNKRYLVDLPNNKSTIEPVSAADSLGIGNMIFIRYNGQPAPPFDKYYQPFQKLDRVYWSLVGASGATSGDEREQVYNLAQANDNIVGFILDDFFHASLTDPAHTEGFWIAEKSATFPVIITITPPNPVRCDTLVLVQSELPTGDYRSKEFAIELSADGKEFNRVATDTLPNTAAAKVKVKLPDQQFAALRIRILSSYDTKGAISCGLEVLSLYTRGKRIDLKSWTASASSNSRGFVAANLLGGLVPFPASLTPQQLRNLGERKVRGKQLPIMAVVYTGQISPRAQAHVDQVDQVCMWTWRPEDLKHLETNLTKLEKLVGQKPIFLGCYMFDFGDTKPLEVGLMKRQTELGYQWLCQGRIKGMIFLASPICDVNLESVEWTRQWIRRVGDQVLPVVKP